MFEVISSETTYLKELEIISKFKDNHALAKVMAVRQNDMIFGNIEDVQETSQR